MRNLLIVSLLATGLLGCATVGNEIQFTVKVDPKANMTGYKTYAWAGSLAELNDPDRIWVRSKFDLDAEIRFLVDKELRAKGLGVTDNKPDLSVMYMMVVDTDKQAAEMRQKYGEQADISGLSEGALVVGLVDSETGFVVWLGAARTPVEPFRDDATAKARLAAAVQGMFQEFNR